MAKPTKQVIIIRKDLKMRRGKEIAQGSHASMSFLTRRISEKTATIASSGEIVVYFWIRDVELEWLEDGFRKITLQVNSESELLNVYQKAKDAGLEAHLITDSGTTEFNGVPTTTAVAIGPDHDELIDPITKDLALY